ncbi:MAG: permease, partial [Planctomycetota bacterium]
MVAYVLACWAVLLELAPWLLLGATVAGLLHVTVPRSFIRRHLGGGRLASAVKAAILGVPMPLCSCSVIPTGLGLKRDGARTGATVSFMVATPETGVDSIAVTGAMLGWPFAVFKVIVAFVTGVSAGYLADRDDASTAAPLATADADVRGRRLAVAFGFVIGDLLHSIWRWLVVGILVSAALTVWLPAGSWPAAATGPWAMVLALAVSLPLYVCAVASVPIAAALVAAGMPTGAALVFLMAGPATNIATIGAIGRNLGWRVATIYLATIIVGSVGGGLLYDAWIGLSVADGHHGHHHDEGGGVVATLSA